MWELDPVGEDDADACADGVCDGVSAEATCLATISGPTIKKNQIDPRFIVIEPNGLAANETCRTTVYVVTRPASGEGKGKKTVQQFEPTVCEMADTDGGGSVINTVTMNEGVKTFDPATNELLSGPIGAIHDRPETLGGLLLQQREGIGRLDREQFVHPGPQCVGQPLHQVDARRGNGASERIVNPLYKVAISVLICWRNQRESADTDSDDGQSVSGAMD